MTSKFDHNEVARFVISHYFHGDLDQASQQTRFSKQQLQKWFSGITKPQLKNLDELIHDVIVPKFTILFEYREFDSNGPVHAQLAKLFKNRDIKSGGIYAFYDSMANLIYVGKSKDNLFTECKNRLNFSLDGLKLLPSGAIQTAKKRSDVVKYVSAYTVKTSAFGDHAKHVESLILRLSKPRLNKNIGKL